MNSRINLVTIILAFFSIALMAWIIIGGPFSTYYLVWNLILAWVPMVFALVVNRYLREQSSRKRNIIILLSSFLWLFFFPNAVYLITDYIHLSNDIFYYANPNFEPYSGDASILYSFDLLPWNNFFSITFGVFLGCALSVLSLYIFHNYIEKKKGKSVGWMFVIAVHLLSGYAIYIGRFIRFNSWDVIFNPVALIKILLFNLDKTAITFSLYFFLLSLFVYSIFYLFIYVTKDNKNLS